MPLTECPCRLHCATLLRERERYDTTYGGTECLICDCQTRVRPPTMVVGSPVLECRATWAWLWARKVRFSVRRYSAPLGRDPCRNAFVRPWPKEENGLCYLGMEYTYYSLASMPGTSYNSTARAMAAPPSSGPPRIVEYSLTIARQTAWGAVPRPFGSRHFH